MKIGIDVAKWNEITDYQKVKDSGVEFAITKVINKGNTADSRLKTHIEGFKRVGIPCNMGYTYSYANTISKAIIAANAFVENAEPLGIDCMWLDLEDATMQNLGQSIVNIIDTYKNVATANGMKFGIYTYYYYYNKYLLPYIPYLKNIPFWIARYPNMLDKKISDGVPETTKFPSGIDIEGWQYSSKGKIDGINGYTDIDVWYNDQAFVSNTSIKIITTDFNPFTEPTVNCRIGTTGNDADWVLWYLWRFGKLLDSNGNPDASQIDSHYTNSTAKIVKEVQKELGFTGKNIDGIVGPKTRALFKKLA
jgi:GH25 family lysozyme M1 (1,4-beta-N-acetylmuramidase)